MKKLITMVAAAAATLLAGGVASAQSLSDILKSAASSSTVKSAIESATGVSLNSSIVGTWTYSGSAASLESDNTLSEIAGNAAISTVTGKMDSYLSKIGVKAGTFSYTFASDSTFTNTFKSKTVSGTYSISEDGKRLTLKYGSQLQLLSMSGNVDVTSSTCKILFDADELLTYLKKMSKLTKSSSNSALSTLSAAASSYDGINLGFELDKK